MLSRLNMMWRNDFFFSVVSATRSTLESLVTPYVTREMREGTRVFFFNSTHNLSSIMGHLTCLKEPVFALWFTIKMTGQMWRIMEWISLQDLAARLESSGTRYGQYESGYRARREVNRYYLSAVITFCGFPEHWIIFYQVCNTIVWRLDLFIFDSTVNKDGSGYEL